MVCRLKLSLSLSLVDFTMAMNLTYSILVENSQNAKQEREKRLKNKRNGKRYDRAR
jgi:hypothetical protein